MWFNMIWISINSVWVEIVSLVAVLGCEYENALVKRIIQNQVPGGKLILTFYNNQKMLTKTEVQLRFAKILQKQNNSCCFQCGKESKKWVETRHAIFLCGACKGIFSKERVTSLKTINEDIWMSQEIEKIEVGGNNKFQSYINEYNLKSLGPQVYLYSEACKFYRIYLMNHLRVDLSSRPSIDQGIVVPVSETPENHEILEQAKVAFSKAGETAQYYGNAAYEAISHKIPISDIKEDALKAVDALGETAKSIWDFVSHKVGEISKN